jgi:ribosomal-protein-alanine N-acetyltransferase
VDRSFFKDLNTEWLLLRNISLDDADFIVREFSDPLVSKYLVDAEPFQSVDEARDMINWYNNESLDHNRWVIINKATGLRLGTCGFHIWDSRNNRVEVGYDLLPENWGKGYMSEALRKAIGFAFDYMNIHRISAHVYKGNARSIKLLRKLGFKKEGLLREEYFFHGKYYDHFLYSLLKSEGG